MLVVGLGNPGRKYAKTKHNSGYMFVDKVAESAKCQFFLEKKFQAQIAHFVIEGTEIVLMKPITYMNNSGLAVKSYVDYYQVPLTDLIIVYDDMDTAIGSLRLRKSGSSGGQKGMKSIIEQLGTEEIKRIRIGIGHEDGDVIDYVLTPIAKSEQKPYHEALIKAPNIVDDLCHHDFDYVMNHYNGHGE